MKISVLQPFHSCVTSEQESTRTNFRRWSKQGQAPSISRFCKYTGALYQSFSTERFALVAFGDLKISINYNCLLYIPYVSFHCHFYIKIFLLTMFVSLFETYFRSFFLMFWWFMYLPYPIHLGLSFYSKNWIIFVSLLETYFQFFF